MVDQPGKGAWKARLEIRPLKTLYKPAWRNGIRVCLKNRFLHGIEGSNPSTGITRLTGSTVVSPYSISRFRFHGML